MKLRRILSLFLLSIVLCATGCGGIPVVPPAGQPEEPANPEEPVNPENPSNPENPPEEGKKTVVKIYLIGGQSNAIGSSPISELIHKDKYEKPVDNVFLYSGCPGAEELGIANKFVPVKAGYGCNADHFGSEVGMAEILRPEEGESVYFVKVAEGDTSLDDMWRSPSAGRIGYLYKDLVRCACEAVMKLSETYEVEIAGMAWMQGERDALVQSTAEQYGELLEKFIDDLYRDLDCEFPFVIGEIYPNETLMPYCGTVISEVRAVAEKRSLVTSFTTARLDMKSYDPFHYTGESALELGKMFGKALKEAE